MKPIEEWLEELPEPIKSRALYNRSMSDWAEKWGYYDASSLWEALSFGFKWDNTTEGEDYWMEIKECVEGRWNIDELLLIAESYPEFAEPVFYSAAYPKTPTKFLEGIEL